MPSDAVFSRDLGFSNLNCYFPIAFGLVNMIINSQIAEFLKWENTYSTFVNRVNVQEANTNRSINEQYKQLKIRSSLSRDINKLFKNMCYFILFCYYS